MQARLHIGEEETTIELGKENGISEKVVLAFGSLDLCRRYFQHVPPTPVELEAAIAAVEDELMPAIPQLVSEAHLFTADAESVALGRSAGVSFDQNLELDLAAVERLFNRLANVAYGRPAAHEGIPERGTFAANLLILRELMHHVGYESIRVGPLTAAVAPTAMGDRRKRQNDLLDEALEETFPASDPVSVVRVK